MELDKIFDDIAQQMRSDFEKTLKATSHPVLRGEGIEETFREFLRKYLPRSLDISKGILFDTTGNSSRQLDVIITDAIKTPIFYSSGETRAIPIECAYAVIEVKKHLDARQLKLIFENMESVRSLKKKAYFPQSKYDTIWLHYGREWEVWPVNYFGFAFTSTNLDRLKAAIERQHQQKQYPLWSRLDTVCVFDKGIITNKLSEDNYSAVPEPSSELMARPNPNPLLIFYGLISGLLSQAQSPNFNFSDYIEHIAV